MNDYKAANEHLSQLAAYDIGAGADTNESAAVVQNGVMSFVTGIEAVAKQDAMNTYLYATMVADKKVPSREGKQWFTWFCTVMKQSGWVEIRSDYRQHSSKKRTFTLEEVAVEILKGAVVSAAMSGASAVVALDTARKALDALGKKDGPLKLFDRYVRSDRGGNLGLSSALQTPEGDVILNVGSLHYSTDTNATSVLFSNWDSADVQIYQGASSFIMNRQLISVSRQLIANKLASNLLSKIEEYDI